ncbi:MAG: anti-sigma factor [Phormidesmis sp.]
MSNPSTGQSTLSYRVSQLVAGYVLNTLDETEATEFAQMIGDDPDILQEIDQMQQALEHAWNIDETPPPSSMKSQVMAAANLGRASKQRPDTAQTAAPATEQVAIEQATTEQALSPLPTASPARSPTLWRWIQAGVVALIVALGLGNYVLWRSLRAQIAIAPTPDQIPGQADRIADRLSYTLSELEEAGPSQAEVTIDPDALTAQLTATQLPPLAPEEVYVLWTVLTPEAPFTTDSKGAILTATFQVDDDGNARKELTVPAAFRETDAVAALGITVESADAPQAHEGEPILLSPL